MTRGFRLHEEGQPAEGVGLLRCGGNGYRSRTRERPRPTRNADTTATRIVATTTCTSNVIQKLWV